MCSEADLSGEVEPKLNSAEWADNLLASWDVSASRCHLDVCQESAVEPVTDTEKMSKLLV